MSQDTGSSNLQHVRWPWIPFASVLIFFCFYFTAAAYYPGGTKFDAARLGFSVLDNYWCDLFDQPTYGGHDNPARPIALLGLTILCVGLSVFWWMIPRQFPAHPLSGRLVRFAGVLSGVIIPGIASPYHDTVIDYAGLMGAIAFSITTFALLRQSPRLHTALALTSLALTVGNFVIWKTGVGIMQLPILQKLTFASFLLWIVLSSRRLLIRG